MTGYAFFDSPDREDYELNHLNVIGPGFGPKFLRAVDISQNRQFDQLHKAAKISTLTIDPGDSKAINSDSAWKTDLEEQVLMNLDTCSLPPWLLLGRAKTTVTPLSRKPM